MRIFPSLLSQPNRAAVKIYAPGREIILEPSPDEESLRKIFLDTPRLSAL
jgi:hypothetical protein